MIFNKVPIYQSLVLNYLFLNNWLIQKSTNNEELNIFVSIKELPIWFIHLLINLFFIYQIYLKKIKIANSPIFYVVTIFIYQFYNIHKISSKYFWNTIPDSRTYKQLGETLLECKKLALSCNSEPFLQWPIGQPIISGVLSRYFYEYTKYIYLIIFLIAFYYLMKITKKNFNNFYHYGAIFFVLLPNNYELTSFVISEIPYIAATSLGLFNLKTKNNYLSLFCFILSFIIRPIGLTNLLGYGLYFIFKKNYKHFYKCVVLIAFSLFVFATYNYFFNGRFIISTTISTNVTNDAVQQNVDTSEFVKNLQTKENILFVIDNSKRLYGVGSRDCVFSYCALYNPLFTNDGTVPQLVPKDSYLGYSLNYLLSELFKIGSPLGIWVYLPFTYILLIRKKNNFDNLVIFLFFGNVFLSILTAEYGSRWWLLPNLLSIYLFSNLIYKINNKVKNNLV